MSPFAAEALAEGHRALTQDPLCGIDGKLAPVVDQAGYAQAPGAVSRHEEGHSVRDLVGGPREIVIRSDRLAGGVEGFARVLEGLLRAVQ